MIAVLSHSGNYLMEGCQLVVGNAVHHDVFEAVVHGQQDIFEILVFDFKSQVVYASVIIVSDDLEKSLAGKGIY